MRRTLAEIGEIVGGRVAGNGDRVITGVASLSAAGEDDITFARDAAKLTDSRAGAAIVHDRADVPGRDVILHAHPHAAMRQLLLREFPDPAPPRGVSELAVVHASARLGDDVSVAPFAVVESDAVLGDAVQVHAGAYVGHGVRVGPGTRLFPHSVLYPRVTVGARCTVHAGAVIGRPGFGYVRVDGQHRHVPQLGGVLVGDDVDVGACACIDGGSFEPTRIGDGAKIDNLVQVGHNCDIGPRVFLCSQVGLAGSSDVGPDSVLGGQVGVVGHLAIGAGVQVAGRAMVTGDVVDGSVVGGVPHMDVRQWRRSAAVVRSLPEMRQELRALRKRIEELESR